MRQGFFRKNDWQKYSLLKIFSSALTLREFEFFVRENICVKMLKYCAKIWLSLANLQNICCTVTALQIFVFLTNGIPLLKFPASPCLLKLMDSKIFASTLMARLLTGFFFLHFHIYRYIWYIGSGKFSKFIIDAPLHLLTSAFVYLGPKSDVAQQFCAVGGFPGNNLWAPQFIIHLPGLARSCIREAKWSKWSVLQRFT